MQSHSFICGEDYKGKKLGMPTHADTPCCNECILMITYCALKITKRNVKY
jgi:hypothetical protein